MRDEKIGLHTDISIMASVKKIKNLAEEHPDALWTPAIIKNQRRE